MTTKEFSYTMTVQGEDGKLMRLNEYNHRNGYRKSMFSTEKAARKSMMNTIALNEGIGRKVVSWKLTRNDEPIDSMK